MCVCVCVHEFVCARMCMFVLKRGEKELSLSSSCNAAATDCFSLVGHCGFSVGGEGGLLAKVRGRGRGVLLG